MVNILVIFQVYINIILASLLDYFVIVYLNNILIYSRNEDKYYNYIRQVFIRLYKNNLFYKLNKYKFNIKEIEFLGFLISIENI